MTRFILPILLGAAIGPALGSFGPGTSGTCLLTTPWWHGALFRALAGVLVTGSSSAQP
ncbi:MAG: DUF6132 family protein [Verrucomicrobia bacterium]|nr:DUF6132 family protein [Verrucomicrobiota bacterium]MDA1203215.1 DUF6132 family protein [Verrucomicrobiota bacterium]